MISLEELRTILGNEGTFSGLLLDGKSLEDEFAEIDTSCDGGISYSEFRAYLENEAKKNDLDTPLMLETFGASSRRSSLASRTSEKRSSLTSMAGRAREQPPSAKTETIQRLQRRVDDAFSHRRSALLECSSAVD